MAEPASIHRVRVFKHPVNEWNRFFVIKVKLVDSLQFFRIELLVQLSFLLVPG